jgi:hypothetical protein
MDIPIENPTGQRRKIHKIVTSVALDTELYDLAKKSNISFTDAFTVGIKIFLEERNLIDYSGYVTRARFQQVVKELQEARTRDKEKDDEKEAMKLLNDIEKEAKNGVKDKGN